MEQLNPLEAYAHDDKPTLQTLEKRRELVSSPAPHGESNTPIPVKTAVPESVQGSPRGFKEFETVLSKGRGGLGLVLDAKCGVMIVSDIREGVISQYNRCNEPDHQFRKHDFILTVNGHWDIQQILSEMRMQETLSFKVRRSEPFRINISKGDAARPLGCHFIFTDDSTSMSIKSISDGPVTEHNQHAPEGQRLRVFDTILSVNGVGGKPKDMIEAVRADKELILEVIRPPAVGPTA